RSASAHPSACRRLPTSPSPPRGSSPVPIARRPDHLRDRALQNWWHSRWHCCAEDAEAGYALEFIPCGTSCRAHDHAEGTPDSRFPRTIWEGGFRACAGGHVLIALRGGHLASASPSSSLV